MDKFVIRSTKDKQLFKEKKNSDPDDPVTSEETCISSSKTPSKISKLDQKQLKDASEKNSNTNPFNEVHLWPSEWTYNQWIQKKDRYPWLICDDGKIGCLYCKNVGELKTCKSQGVEISTEWSQINVDGGTNSKLVTRLSILRHKISRHNRSKAHNFALNISREKTHSKLSTSFETSTSKHYQSTIKIFRTVYFIAKNNRPFDDHSDLVELQQMNGVLLGQTLHSRYSSTSIIDHIATKMRNKIIQNIIETNSKISILIDESTTNSSSSGMIIYLKASISYDSPVFIFLDLIELKSQTSINIIDQLLECLHQRGFTDIYLKEHWISFVTDGASVLLGKTNGVAARLKEKFPIIFSWHCINHRLELAVNDVLKDITATSYRTVKVVWKMYPALYKHFKEASEDKYRDQKTRSKYKGLCKRLESLQFLSDLALMCDVLSELSQLSLDLQSRDATLIQADKKIKRTIRVIDSLKTINDKKTWPADVNIRFGEQEVKRLCNRFLLNQEKTLRGLRILIDEETNEIEELNEINNLIKTIPCSTAECERGFSLMNIICTDIRSRLTIHNISNLMMININGPPLSIWDPEDYVKILPKIGKINTSQYEIFHLCQSTCRKAQQLGIICSFPVQREDVEVYGMSVLSLKCDDTL
ncbi:E3 SUMO-protein ligase KIAA1586-like [Myzus persicae]|uniref:E3 SUMO-protein ligase KIAA1586-like n=1 Tax=Myzus persicae TaxID=13164 RepID=UPI000B938AAF|nr:E3 SUMO-protein ligase KIAA1586-like [Myzus persicae]